MRNFDPGIVLYVIFIAAILINSFWKRYQAQQRRQQQQRQHQPQSTPPLDDEADELISTTNQETLPPVFGRKPIAKRTHQKSLSMPFSQEISTPENKIATQPKRSHRRLFGNPADARAAIIGMTVLGPCRATLPYGDDGLMVPKRPR